MDDIIFVKPSQSFQSYTDYWRLVKLSGFQVHPLNQIDLQRHVTYIVSPLTVEWCPKVDDWNGKPRSTHLVLWHLERPVACGGIGNFRRQGEDLMSGRYFDEIWVSDRRLATESGFRFVVFGSDGRLGHPGLRKSYDVAHMSYVNERRKKALDGLTAFKVAPNGWKRQRDKELKQSRFGLNIHQDQHPFQEPMRLALFAAYGLPTVSESITDPYPFSEYTLILARYSELAEKLSAVLAGSYWTYRQIGLAARRLLCDYFQFGRVVREAVAKSTNPIFITGI